MKWCFIFFLGLCTIIFAFYDYQKAEELQMPIVILLIVGIVCCSIAVLRPDSLKFGDYEMNGLRNQAVAAAAKAEHSAKLAIEASAMSIWNQGRVGGEEGSEPQEKLATEVLRKAYGKDTDKTKYFLQHQGLFLTPSDELKKVPNVKLNNDELPEIYKLKTLDQKAK